MVSLESLLAEVDMEAGDTQWGFGIDVVYGSNKMWMYTYLFVQPGTKPVHQASFEPSFEEMESRRMELHVWIEIRIESTQSAPTPSG